MEVKDFLDYELKDDNTEFGGISYIGETLGDFIAEVEISDIDDVNIILKECGIEPIVIS